MTDTVLCERRARTLIVSIDRPHARNAVDSATGAALAAAFRDFDADAALDVAILTGTQGTFCAGADLKAVASGEPSQRSRTHPHDGHMGPTRMLLGKPVLAAVEGHAVAGGLELALWCDMRIAAEDAVFGVYCRRWGVPLMDGGTHRLPRLVGHSHAMDLILTGRGVSGEEALRMGLANRIVPKGQALEAALALAEQLSAFPQRCLRSDRLLAHRQWALTEADALRLEGRMGNDVIRSGETRAGAARFAAGKGRSGDFSNI
jgi:enoyl-CoA hydratase